MRKSGLKSEWPERVNHVRVWGGRNTMCRCCLKGSKSVLFKEDRVTKDWGQKMRETGEL